jgi:ferredoxin
MSIETFNDRHIENRPGKYYVDSQCLDCDLCRATAPGVFNRFNSGGYSYVVKQPETVEELQQVLESMDWCPEGAIHDDGDQFDWGLEVQLQPTKSI